MNRGVEVIYHKQLGDTILLEPALFRLAGFAGRPVQLVCKPQVAALLELMPCVSRMKEARPEDAWAYEKGSKAAWAAFRSGAKSRRLRLRKAQNAKWYHRLVFNDIKFIPGVNLYAARWHWDVTDVETPAEYRPPRLQLPPEAWRPAFDIPSSYILVNATAAARRKCWPAAKWREGLERLAAETNLPVLLTCAGPDWAFEHVAQIRPRLEERVTDLSGKTNLKQFMFLVSRASLVLTVDGACSHLSQAFKRPVVTIFSETNPSNPCSWHYVNQHSIALCERPHPDAEHYNGRPRQPDELVQAAMAVMSPNPATR